MKGATRQWFIGTKIAKGVCLPCQARKFWSQYDILESAQRSAGIEAAFKWQLHKREGLTNRERLQAGVRDLASEFYGSAREDLCQ
eukprot:1159016-Pelagomonas_calceolata.AAC.12